MYNLLKPFGDDREKALVGDLVNFLSLTKPEGPEREKELEEKMERWVYLNDLAERIEEQKAQ